MRRKPPRLVAFVPDAVRNVLLLGAAVLVAADLALAFLQYRLGHDVLVGLPKVLELNAEGTLPARYNAFLLLVAAAACSLVGWIGAPRRRTWLVVSLLFLLLTVDESLSMHERLATPVRETLGTSGLLYFAWVIPYAAICVVLFVLLVPWLRQLPPLIRRGCMGAALLYGTGVFALEGIGGAYISGHGFEFDLIYDLISTAEEGFEMVGITVFVYYALRYVASLTEGVYIVPRVGPEEA